MWALDFTHKLAQKACFCPVIMQCECVEPAGTLAYFHRVTADPKAVSGVRCAWFALKLTRCLCLGPETL